MYKIIETFEKVKEIDSWYKSKYHPIKCTFCSKEIHVKDINCIWVKIGLSVCAPYCNEACLNCWILNNA